jgi:hypothetical protein
VLLTRARARARTASDCGNDTTQTGSLAKVFGLVDDGLAALGLGAVASIRVGVRVTVVVAVAAAAFVVVVIVVAAVHRAGAARGILLAVPGLAVLGSRRGEVARDVLDAVLARRAVDEVAHGSWSSASPAALDVRRLGDVLGLSLAVAPRRIAVLAHGGVCSGCALAVLWLWLWLWL